MTELQSKHTAVLTFSCDVADLIAMHHIMARFMPRRPGTIIKEPRVDQETGEGYVDVLIGAAIGPQHNTIPLIIQQLIRTPAGPGLPTKDDWAKALLNVGMATKVVLNFDNGISGEWSLDIASGIVTGEEGQIIYQTGMEG